MTTERSDLRAGLVALILGIVAFVRRIVPINDPDYFWHLATGRFVLESRTIPSVDPFSHTFAGQPWHFVDWLADAFFFAIQRAGGHDAVILTCALLGAVLIALAIHSELRARTDTRWPIALAIGLLAVTAVISRVTPRPQLFSFLMFALELAILERARTHTRWLAAIPPLVALWQNLHASSILALLVLGAFAAAGIYENRAHAKRWALVLAASTAALFLTARPLERLAAAFEHGTDDRIGDFISEWAPFWVFGYKAPSGIAFMILTALAIVALVMRKKHVKLDRALVAFGLAALAIKSNRFVPFASIAMLPLALEALSALLPAAFSAWTAAAGAAALQLWQAQPLALGLAPGAYPQGAAQFIRDHDLHGNMFNSFRFGGYLLFELEGRHKVFIDGRSFALYGVDFTQKATNPDLKTLDEFITKYEIEFAVVANDNQRMNYLQAREGWGLVYFDDVAFIAAKNQGEPYKIIHPGAWVRDLKELRADPTKLPEARAEADRAVQQAPDAVLPKIVKAAVTLAAGDQDEAAALAEAALAQNPSYVPALGLNIMICYEKSDASCACEYSAALIRLEPRNTYANSISTAMGCGR